MMRDSEGSPLGRYGYVRPSWRCQPPVNAMALIRRLSPDEANRIVRLVAVWAPELLELGLQRVSEIRAIVAEVERERAVVDDGWQDDDEFGDPCDHDCDEDCYDELDQHDCRHEHCFNCGGCGCAGYCDDYQTYNLRPEETGGAL
jgi:hypothetical protein